MTVAPPEKAEKKLQKRWQTWVGLTGVILAIVLGLMELRGKIVPYNPTPQKADSISTAIRLEWQPLEGQILDEQNQPLSEVIVDLPEHNLIDTTNSSGRFEFKVQAPHQAQVILQARKPGYLPIHKYPALGVTFLQYTMEMTK